MIADDPGFKKEMSRNWGMKNQGRNKLEDEKTPPPPLCYELIVWASHLLVICRSFSKFVFK